MPIRAELRPFYGREWSMVIRPRILRRAGGRFSHGIYRGGARCENCGKPDHKRVFTLSNRDSVSSAEQRPFMFWLDETSGLWRNQLGTTCPDLRLKGLPRKIKVVLAVAHVNHIAGDDRDDNLRAWCAWCHLNHDQIHHRETRCIRKDARRPMKFSLPQPVRRDFTDDLEFCRAMQRWAAQDGDGPLRSVCMDDWFAEELLLLEERGNNLSTNLCGTQRVTGSNLTVLVTRE
jgi:hypothetical protein